MEKEEKQKSHSEGLGETEENKETNKNSENIILPQ